MSAEQIAAVAPEIGVGDQRTKPAELWEAIVGLRAANAAVAASGGAQTIQAAAEQVERLAAALHKYLVELVEFDLSFVPGKSLPDEWALPTEELAGEEG